MKPWQPDEDLMLAEIVLRNVREGKRKAAGFREAGEKTGRGEKPAEMRWYNVLSKEYEEAFKLAEKQGKAFKNKNNDTEQVELLLPVIETNQNKDLTTKDVVEFLNNQAKTQEKLQRENADLTYQLSTALQQNQVLSDQVTALQHIEKEYNELLDLIKKVNGQMEN